MLHAGCAAAISTACNRRAAGGAMLCYAMLCYAMLCYAHLGPAKAAESGVAGRVGAADVALDSHVRNLIAVLAVEQRPIHDAGAEVQGVAGIVVQVQVQRHQLALVCEAHLRADKQSASPVARKIQHRLTVVLCVMHALTARCISE